MSARWRHRLHAIGVIQRRDLRGLLFGPGPYLAVALGMLPALLAVRGTLGAIQDGGVVVLSDAFALPFFAAVTIAMFFLALWSVATVARERDQGTLEVLFYGPVDHPSYVLAKHLAQVLAYLPMGLAIALLFLAYAAIAGLRPSGTIPLALVLSVFTAAAVAALGILLSTLTRSVRSAVGLFGAVALLFLAVRVAAELLSGIRVSNNFSPLLFLRDAVLALDWLLGYVSPFSVLQNGVDALVRGDPAGYLAMILLSCLHSALLLGLAVRALARRGVRR